LVAVVLVDGTVVTTPTGVRQIPPDGPLEEALTPLASELTVVLARAFVPANNTVGRRTER